MGCQEVQAVFGPMNVFKLMEVFGYNLPIHICKFFGNSVPLVEYNV